MSHVRQFITREEARPPYFVGVDLGGTNIKVGVVDDEGRPLSWLSIPTQVEKGPEDGARRMAQAVLDAIEQAQLKPQEVAAVGLGTPGTMDIRAGMLLEPGNLPGWWHFQIRDRLAQGCGLPVTFENDANAAAYGEFWVGIGKAFTSMVLFTLGTGVGGGIIVNNLLIDGENSAGGELGHTIIDYNANARMCTCGGRGHLEAYASAHGVIERTREALESGQTSSLKPRLAAGEELTPLMVSEEAEKGDALARQIVFDTARYAGIGAVNAMHTIDPSGVIFGGAMTFGGHDTELGRAFLARIREEVLDRALRVLAGRTVIDFASLGGDAGFIGAAGVARLAHLRK